MSSLQRTIRITFCCLIICSLFIPGKINATTLFSENFEEGLVFDQLLEQGKWELGLPWGESYAGSAEISKEQAHSSSNSIKLVGSTANSKDSIISHPLQTTTNISIVFWLYDNISTNSGYISMVGVSKGDIPANGVKPNMIAGGILNGSRLHYEFLDDQNGDRVETAVPRASGWQKIEFSITNQATDLLINGISVHVSNYITSSSLEYIFVGNLWSTGSVMYFDDIIAETVSSTNTTHATTTQSNQITSESNQKSITGCLGDTTNKGLILSCTEGEWQTIGVILSAAGLLLGVVSFLRKFVFKKK